MTSQEIKSKYKNGKIPKSAMKSIGNNHFLVEDAADSYLQMKEDAQKDGINIILPYATSSYRPCGEQGDYTLRGCSSGFTQWCAWEKYKGGVGNLAANPTSGNCSSSHGWGLAIDIKPTSAQNWVKKNGDKYGWWWSGGTFSQIEDWHFDYDRNRDTMRKTRKGKKNKKFLPYIIGGITLLGISATIYFVVKGTKEK